MTLTGRAPGSPWRPGGCPAGRGAPLAAMVVVRKRHRAAPGKESQQMSATTHPQVDVNDKSLAGARAWFAHKGLSRPREGRLVGRGRRSLRPPLRPQPPRRADHRRRDDPHADPDRLRPCVAAHAQRRRSRGRAGRDGGLNTYQWPRRHGGATPPVLRTLTCSYDPAGSGCGKWLRSAWARARASMTPGSDGGELALIRRSQSRPARRRCPPIRRRSPCRR